MKHANQQETPHYESSTLPYVCWYQNDFLGGVRGMRAHEIGVYTILLNEMYARGRPLELSAERLARLCGCDKRTFINVLEMLIKEGKILNLANGLWNKRCENVFYERAKLLEQKSFAGRSSAKKRKKINDQFQQLLNERARDDEQNSEAQKREEKETPHGVSEKQFLLPEKDAAEARKGTATFLDVCLPSVASAPSSTLQNESSPLLPSEYSSTVAREQDEREHLFTSQANVENASNAQATPQKADNFCTKTKNTPATRSKTKSCTTIAKGHRLPSDWQADIDAAVLEGLSEEQARWQEKKFRDYWHAKSGKEALKVNWQATWRNWFRREIERIKEHQERLAFFASHTAPKPQNSDNDALYRSLINYHNPEEKRDF
ncbi:uncharacterized protein YdaU (DUF1376 family) [Bartonella callosciuri]|uniref:Uncharacterized protein YdaU (DUF1376 family) n=1 Tax=Bartonella callosciuri TaxID=686223 RepID=A0A840NVB6_9HYPH|nr:DUF1376 domain-containing protein [Bartonella callosciuri]MBB5074368.1 uncharacterized protein YdaU (DUF1376 family) [Bartonella callosciuri]